MGKKKTAGVASGYIVPRNTEYAKRARKNGMMEEDRIPFDVAQGRQNTEDSIREWKNGMMEDWNKKKRSDGVMEYWSNATTKELQPSTPILQHSSTPNNQVHVVTECILLDACAIE